MKKLFHLLFCIILTAVFFNGCSGSKGMQGTSEGDIPDWYNNHPQDPNYFYAATTATSQDMQLAVDKATSAARTEIGRIVETRISDLQKKFDEETGIGKDAQLLQQFTGASKTVVSTSLSGSQVVKQKQFKDGDIWRAYVLVQYPVGAANEALQQQIKNNEQMYTRFRASQSFKDLDDEVQKYEEWKKQQQPAQEK
ncbi:MAG: hypothetical protein ABSF91_05555 [Bacteroidota bacterium]|jgi:hypothetical protein